MIQSEYCFSEESPTVDEFNCLRLSVGWPPIENSLAEQALRNSLWLTTIRDHSGLIGMARIVGDGAMYFYVQDLIVKPAKQGKGLGDKLMQRIEYYLQNNARTGATIGLLAAQNKEAFYQRFNYIDRTGDPWGRGMCKFV